MSGLQPHRHQEVPGSFGRRPGQGRGLHLHEVALEQHVAGELVDLRAHAQGIGLAGPAQVEVPVPQPGVLADLDVLVDWERQRCCRRQDLDRLGDDLDLPGGEFRVLVSRRAHPNRARDSDAVLGPEIVRGFVVQDHLDDAGGVAQIQKRHPAVVAPTADPPGQAHLPVGVGCAQASGMGSLHVILLSISRQRPRRREHFVASRIPGA